jgi:uncharacterized protein
MSSTANEMLLQAVELNTLEKVKVALEGGADCNATYPDADTVLMKAARGGNAAIVTALLDAGANVNAFNSVEKLGSYFMPYMILAEGALEEDKPFGFTALMCAASAGHAGIVRLLLDRGANMKIRHLSGQTVLEMMEERNDFEVIAALLERELVGCTAKTLEMECRLLECINPSHPHQGPTSIPALQALLAEIPDIKEVCKRRSPLIAALNNYSFDVMKLLLEHKADVNFKSTRNGNTALMVYFKFHESYGRYPEFMELLLTYKADVNVQNQSGETALMLAASRGLVREVQQLLACKADMNIKDQQGCTALEWAVFGNNVDVMKLLLDGGAEVTVELLSKVETFSAAVNPETIELLKPYVRWESTKYYIGASVFTSRALPESGSGDSESTPSVNPEFALLLKDRRLLDHFGYRLTSRYASIVALFLPSFDFRREPKDFYPLEDDSMSEVGEEEKEGSETPTYLLTP